MNFRQLGGSPQLLVSGLQDLEHLWTLDASRWIASSAPIEAFSADPVFLELLDTDNNGRIHVDELRQGARWLLDRLHHPGGIGTDTLDLSHLSPEAEPLRAVADQVLANLDASDRTSIGLDQVRNLTQIMASGAMNGDGILPASSVEDPELRQFVQDIASTISTIQDASGHHGVMRHHVEQFLAHARDVVQWTQHGQQPSVRWNGEDTETSHDALEAIRAKLDQTFCLAELARFDHRVTDAIQLPDSVLADLLYDPDLPARLLEAPLCWPLGDAIDPLSGWLNPSWKPIWDRFATAILGGPDAPLSRERWQNLCKRAEPYRQWCASRPSTPVADLDLDRLHAYVEQPHFADQVFAFIEQDQRAARELQSIADLEKLLLYQRWLIELVNHFVNASRLYDPTVTSLIEMGTLIMDGRRFSLSLRVQDRVAHKERSQSSALFLLYVWVEPRSDEEAGFDVAVAVTSVERGNLTIGKRGLFVTPDGTVRDALIVDILENPISLLEALREPFERIGTYLIRRVQRLTAERKQRIAAGVKERFAAAQAQIVAVHALADRPDGASDPEPDSDRAVRSLRDLALSGSIALAAVSSSAAYVAKTLTDIDLFALVAMAAALGLSIIVPTVLLALLRLRRRNLAVVLEASGWALNVRLPLPRWAGSVFTRPAPLPAGANRPQLDLLWTFRQQVREDARPWRTLLLGLLLLGLIALWIAAWVIATNYPAWGGL